MSEPSVTPTADEALANLGQGLEDVLTKLFGKEQFQFTLVLHGKNGVVMTTNAVEIDSYAALRMAIDYMEKVKGVGAANCTEDPPP